MVLFCDSLFAFVRNGRRQPRGEREGQRRTTTPAFVSSFASVRTHQGGGKRGRCARATEKTTNLFSFLFLSPQHLFLIFLPHKHRRRFISFSHQFLTARRRRRCAATVLFFLGFTPTSVWWCYLYSPSSTHTRHRLLIFPTLSHTNTHSHSREWVNVCVCVAGEKK